MIDMQVRVSIEKTLKIPETKDNLDILSYCGWMLTQNDQGQPYLKCNCCQRFVPLEILKFLNTSSEFSLKRTFNPLSFHFNFCMFSAFYKSFTNKMSALDILREIVILKKSWKEITADQKNDKLCRSEPPSSIRLLRLRYLKHQRILQD